MVQSGGDHSYQYRATAANLAGESPPSNESSVVGEQGGYPGQSYADGAPEEVAAARVAALPAVTGLHAPHPNPSPGRVTLTLDLAEAVDVEAAAYDVLGRRVAVLASGPLGAGTHDLAFDGSRLPSGVYVVRAEVRGTGAPGVFTRRATVAR